MNAGLGDPSDITQLEKLICVGGRLEGIETDVSRFPYDFLIITSFNSPDQRAGSNDCCYPGGFWVGL
jgi:hypothetical protein